MLLIIGPAYQFILKHRFPFDIPFAWKKEWASVLWNNLFLALAGWGLVSWLGWKTVVLVELPILVIAGAVGVWLFYVQHQFEEVYWDHQEDWDPDRAALEGSSFYDLPRLLHWFTGNIGFQPAAAEGSPADLPHQPALRAAEAVGRGEPTAGAVLGPAGRMTPRSQSALGGP